MTPGPEEQRAWWVRYMQGLSWSKGNLDVCSWWTFLRAASCGVGQSDALGAVESRIRAAGGVVRPAKLGSQCRRAYKFVGASPEKGSTWSPRPGWGKRAKPAFENAKLAAFAEEWAPHVDLVWLANRSKFDPALVSSGGFLEALYEEGEKVLLFNQFRSQGQAYWCSPEDPQQSCFVEWMPGGESSGADVISLRLSGPEGVWFLANPVDGCEHPNPRAMGDDGRVRMSRRSMESVTSWRYLVLESDAAKPRDWLGALVQLPLRIVAIYTSGGKSIHALVRVDAASKAQWDAERDAMMPVLVTLGGDPAAMTAVRLTRLPGCLRGGKMQKLLYLNPGASGLRPICALAPKRDVVAEWLRYAAGADGDGENNPSFQKSVRAGLAFYAPVSEACRESLAELKG